MKPMDYILMVALIFIIFLLGAYTGKRIKCNHTLESLSIPVNQLEVNHQNLKAFKMMENNPLPEYK